MTREGGGSRSLVPPETWARERIERALASDDVEERRQGTLHTLDLDPSDVVAPLMRALGDADWRVRKEATIAARAFTSDEKMLDALAAALGGGDNVGLKNAVVDVLAAAGPAATARMTAAFAALDADGRKLVVEVLGRSRDPAALAPLERALEDEDDNVREATIEAIAQLGSLRRDRVETFLVTSLDDRDPLVVLTALEGLTSLGATVPWKILSPMLKDPTLRSAAIAAAARSDAPEAAEELVNALGDAKGSAFAHVVAAAAKLSHGAAQAHVAKALRGAKPALLDRLAEVAEDERGEIDLRLAALRLAVLAGASRAVDVAIAALREERMAQAAEAALVACGPLALATLVERLGDPSTDSEVRASLALAIAAICGESAFAAPSSAEQSEAASRAASSQPALLSTLRSVARDPDRRIVQSALFALARLGTEADISIAAVQTLSESPAIARSAEAALVALAARYPTAARQRAETMAEQEASFLPASILLAATGRDEARLEQDMAFLAHAATAGDLHARRAAMDAAAEINGPSAREILSFALADEEHEVRVAAARGLGKIAASSRGSRELLGLVAETGGADLVAAAVRAIGEGIAKARSSAPASGAHPDSDDLFATLGDYAKSAEGPIAMAAIDALGSVLRAGRLATDALANALDHADVSVVRAAMLKLAATPEGRERLKRSLDHDAPSVRTLASEMLGDARAPAEENAR